MYRLRLIALPFLAAGLMGTVPAEAPEITAARDLTGKFQAKLQAELMSGIKEGGPLNAIAVCRTKAPQIAKELSEGSGWEVRRTALKVRNSSNQPDDWERKVLEEFSSRAEAGEDISKLEKTETVDLHGKRLFRYMKAIRTGDPCLTCHGKNIKPELEAKVKSLYPDDKAVGFEQGKLRGAFSLTKTVTP